jgi:glycosyltransferase involved in cell wall biosynthesis
MRIALLALHFSEYSCRLAAALAARQHDVLLILSAPNAEGELEGELAAYRAMPRLRVVCLPHGRGARLQLANTLDIVGQVRRFKPDVVHAQEVTKDYLVAALLCLKPFYPLVLTVHDPLPHSGEDAKAIVGSRHQLYHKLLRALADRAITHGEGLRAELCRVRPGLAGRVAVIPHGPLGPLAGPDGEPEQNCLLFFGRINVYKGLRYFVEACLLLRARGLPLRAVIAGRGADLEPNRGAIEANDCFELHDRYVPRAAVNELFGRAQLVVMPYIDATQSGVAAMAMGFGRPVVATRVGSIPEMVADGVSGVLVPPRDAAALADAIEALLRSPERYRAMRAQVRLAAATTLGWDAIAARTVELYRVARG